MMGCKKTLLNVEKSEFAQLFKTEKNIKTISFLKKTVVPNIKYNPINDENLSLDIVNMIIQKVDMENQKKLSLMQATNKSEESNFKMVNFKLSKNIDINEKFIKDKIEIHQSPISVNMYENIKEMAVPQKRNFDNEYSVKKELQINQGDKICKMSSEYKITALSDQIFSNRYSPKTETNYNYNNKRYNNFYRYDRGYRYQSYKRRNYSSNNNGYYYNRYQPRYLYNRSQSYNNYYYY